MAARVLVVGAGGLGSPMLLYLAAAGVGTLGIVDDDTVDLSNLQRQIVHPTSRIGDAEGRERAARRSPRSTPRSRSRPHAVRLDATNAAALVGAYDLVADGSDNFATRYLLNDAVLPPRQAAGRGGAVAVRGPALDLQVLSRAAAPLLPLPLPRAAAAGRACRAARRPASSGAVAGVIGTLQATEVLKELLGIGESLSGRLLIYDALRSRFPPHQAAARSRLPDLRPGVTERCCPRPTARCASSRAPSAFPQAEHFEIVDGAARRNRRSASSLVRNEFLSVDPAMRGWVNAVGNYSQPVAHRRGDARLRVRRGCRLAPSRLQGRRPGHGAAWLAGIRHRATAPACARCVRPTCRCRCRWACLASMASPLISGCSMSARPLPGDTVVVSTAAGVGRLGGRTDRQARWAAARSASPAGRKRSGCAATNSATTRR